MKKIRPLYMYSYAVDHVFEWEAPKYNDNNVCAAAVESRHDMRAG